MEASEGPDRRPGPVRFRHVGTGATVELPSFATLTTERAVLRQLAALGHGAEAPAVFARMRALAPRLGPDAAYARARQEWEGHIPATDA